MSNGATYIHTCIIVYNIYNMLGYREIMVTRALVAPKVLGSTSRESEYFHNLTGLCFQ